MSAQIITAIQQKGGTGKTTLLCMLASLMAEDNARVAMIDTDPQESASDFAKSCEEAGISIDYLREFDEDVIVQTVKGIAAAGNHDVIFIDTAGIVSRITDYAVHLADLVLVPVKPARPDVKGLMKSLKAVERVQGLRDMTIPTYIVLSDVDRQARITSTWLDELKALETPMLDARIYHRTGFREFMTAGGPLTGNARKVAREVLGEMQMKTLIKFYDHAAAAE